MNDIFKDFFDIDKGGQKATCLTCEEIVPMTAGTNRIREHLKNHHEDAFQAVLNSAPLARGHKRPPSEDPEAFLAALDSSQSNASESSDQQNLDDTQDDIADITVVSTSTPRKMKVVYTRYFNWTERQSASCLQCGRVVPTKNGNTSGLRSHLKYHHKKDYADLIASTPQAPQAKRPKSSAPWLEQNASLLEQNNVTLPVEGTSPHESEHEVAAINGSQQLSLQDQLLLEQIKLVKQRRRESQLRCERLERQLAAMRGDSGQGQNEAFLSSEDEMDSNEDEMDNGEKTIKEEEDWC
uniref:BED-type domain-containing protein n=1 Tax=Steinernema glaseri TaxID=37863 RepID=A0A1I8A6R0_9BILA